MSFYPCSFLREDDILPYDDLFKYSVMPEGRFKWRSHICSAKRISKIPQGMYFIACLPTATQLNFVFLRIQMYDLRRIVGF